MNSIETFAASVCVPAIHLVHTDAPSRSHLGGDPRLPAGLDWPSRDGRRLDFLARLSLAELARARPIAWLPRQGALLFFYDTQEQVWGFSPQDRGHWAVLHVDDLPEPLSLADDEGAGAPRRHLACRAIDCLPSTQRPVFDGVHWTDQEVGAYDDLRFLMFDDAPTHQVGGLPIEVQNDGMELECQLASQGLDCGNPSVYDDPRVDALRAGAKDWRLLLQLDSDKAVGFTWGDLGSIYFWVREQEAAAGRFENAWLVLQCS